MERNNWQWFNVGKLFTLQKCKCSNATEMLEEGNEIAYIGAKKTDNGVMQMVKRVDELVTRGNCLVFIGDGQGSVGYSIYQPVDFIGSTTLIAGYNEHINPYTASFLISVLDKERFRYSFGRKYKKEVISNSYIQLPAIKNTNDEYEPDWRFIEDFVKDQIIPQLPKKAQRVWLQKYDITPQQDMKMRLNTDEWKWFLLKDLFQLKRGKRLTEYDREKGDIPFVTAGVGNNGVSEYISNEVELYKNAITIDMFGCAFYRNYTFACDDNILVLTNDNLNYSSGLFIASIIDRDKYKFAYGRQYRQKSFNKHVIKLPVTPEGTPDWQFMEDYIKSLPYSRNLEPSKPDEVVDELMEVKRRVIEMQKQLAAQQPGSINNYGTANIYEK